MFTVIEMPEDFLQSVLNELVGFKQNVPLELRKNLNPETFTAFTYSKCIYGQTFGHSYNDEAETMKQKVSERSYDGWETDISTPSYDVFQQPDFGNDSNQKHTALEKYAYIKQEMNQKDKILNLFPYLTGKTDKRPTISDLK